MTSNIFEFSHNIAGILRKEFPNADTIESVWCASLLRIVHSSAFLSRPYNGVVTSYGTMAESSSIELPIDVQFGPNQTLSPFGRDFVTNFTVHCPVLMDDSAYTFEQCRNR